MAMCAAVMLGGWPAFASAAVALLFGSNETAIGRASAQLSLNRYERLLVSSGLEDQAVAHKWSVITRLIRWQTPLNKLKLVQQYFNTMPYGTDQQIYGKADYWASVGEFLTRGGDCEDFAITKYRALVEGGFAPESLRVVLVNDRVNGTAHAVLAAYLDGRIWILDNQIDHLMDHRAIGHYQALYSLNAISVWRHDMPAPRLPLAELEIATRAE